MSDKRAYRELCRSEPTIPLFSRDWWLDSTCGSGNWDVVLLRQEGNGQIVGSLPYYVERKMGMTHITMPKLTQTMGPWIWYPYGMKGRKRLSHEEKVLSGLIEALPPFDLFRQNFHYSMTNWLPFYWKGFHQTTRYTYVLPDLSDLGAVYGNISLSVRRDVKKALQSVQVESSEDIELFYRMNTFAFKKNNKAMPYSLDFLKRLDSACRERGCRRILLAVGRDDSVHAALYTVWCEDSAYALMSGIDPSYGGDGSMSLLFWEAIKQASEVTRKFDFEGSMLRPVERAFRAFGTIQTPYSQVTRIDPLPLRFWEGLKQAVVDKRYRNIAR